MIHDSSTRGVDSSAIEIKNSTMIHDFSALSNNELDVGITGNPKGALLNLLIYIMNLRKAQREQFFNEYSKSSDDKDHSSEPFFKDYSMPSDANVNPSHVNCSSIDANDNTSDDKNYSSESFIYEQLEKQIQATQSMADHLKSLLSEEDFDQVFQQVMNLYYDNCL